MLNGSDQLFPPGRSETVFFFIQTELTSLIEVCNYFCLYRFSQHQPLAMVYDVNLIATLLLGWTAMCQGKMMDTADEPKSVIKEYKAGRILDNTSASSTKSLDNATCCNFKDKYLKTNLTMNCSNSLGLKTSHKRHTRSPIMVPVDYSKTDIKKLKKVVKLIDTEKEPGELQDLIGAVKPSEESWEFHKDFRDYYNRTKQRNIEHPQGYYSIPSEKINFTGGYAVIEIDDGNADVEDRIQKWKEDPVMYDMTGDGSDKDYTKEVGGEEEDVDKKRKNEGVEGSDDDDDVSKDNEEEEEKEVDLSDQFEDDKLEPPEFRDKFYKTRPYYKYLKYPRDATAEASTENEKTTDESVDKNKGDVQNVTISYKPLNETKDVGFYRPAPLQQTPYNRPQPHYRPYNDGGGMYVFRKRSPYERNNRKIVLVNSPVPRKPKFLIRSSNCNGCMMPRNVVRKVGMPMYYYPLTKVPPNRFRHVVYPPKYYNKPLYGSQSFPGDARFLPGDLRGTGDNRFMNSGEFRGNGGNRFVVNSGNFRTSGDQKALTSPLKDPKSQSIPNLIEPKKELQTRHQRHNPNFDLEDADPDSKRSELHIVRDTPAGYDDTVIYHERKYVPTDLEISASEPYRPDPFREVEDEHSERIERLNDLIERETDKTSREIDREYDYWDDN